MTQATRAQQWAEATGNSRPDPLPSCGGACKARELFARVSQTARAVLELNLQTANRRCYAAGFAILQLGRVRLDGRGVWGHLVLD